MRDWRVDIGTVEKCTELQFSLKINMKKWALQNENLSNFPLNFHFSTLPLNTNLKSKKIFKDILLKKFDGFCDNLYSNFI